MRQSFKNIVTAKISTKHFLLVLLLLFLFCSILYALIIPIFYWFAFGEGEIAAQIESLTINTIILNWGALIIALTISTFSLIKNLKVGSFSKAKSYLLSAPILIALYFFRFNIGEFLIDLFQ